MDAFLIDATEVTVGAYKTCVDAGGCSQPQTYTDNALCNWQSPRGDTDPINCVTWDMADNYCQRQGKRLPTSAEWEFAVRGPDEKTLQRILELVPIIGDETGLDVAVSAGILDADQARRLADGGVHRYNHNLETSRSYFPEVVKTHGFDERWETCELVKANDMELCCGVLLGMGESDDQRLELIGHLQELRPQEVPVNFLNPRPGTPLELKPITPAKDALKWVALFRLALPEVILRYAGGREITLGDMQEAGMTAGINALIVGNYLTTLGRSPDEDLDMLERLSMPVGALSKVV